MKHFTLSILASAALSTTVMAGPIEKSPLGNNDAKAMSSSDYENVLAKYDKNGNGELDKKELKRYFEDNSSTSTLASSEQRKGDKVTVTQKPAQITVNQKPAQITVRQPKPEVTITTQDPDITIDQPEPKVEVAQSKPQIKVDPGKPAIDVQQEDPQIDVKQRDPSVEVEESELEVAVNKKR
ncbi:hypothetical protein [Alteromonas sp. ASW11-130]|uniref:hypothetical protein n=1 Tax=Alteromonas sp. ASW11-130 TaxID=3015775 RepID=UPI002241A941|nr:hypothetical protein [Alteromonas sp. ASW11-130]MCW8092331.1 hypothetical protein [Alteromonas sp. ASW11-130]